MAKSTVDLNESLTRYVANLARLELSDDEVSKFTGQLGDILKYIEQLQEVDVSSVSPLTHPLALETPFREDKIVSPPKTDQGKPKVLNSAPEVMNDGYKVPKII